MQEQELSVPQALGELLIFGYFVEPVYVELQEKGVLVETVVSVVPLEKGVSVETAVPEIPEEKGISAEEKVFSVEKKAIFVQGKGISAERNVLDPQKFQQKSLQRVRDPLTSCLDVLDVADLLVKWKLKWKWK